MDEDKYEVVKELIITMIETAKDTVQKNINQMRVKMY